MIHLGKKIRFVISIYLDLQHRVLAFLKNCFGNYVFRRPITSPQRERVNHGAAGIIHSLALRAWICATRDLPRVPVDRKRRPSIGVVELFAGLQHRRP